MRARVSLIVLGLAASSLARAQCADGTPGCRKGNAPIAAPQRAAVPLDQKRWIVVPFDNSANNSEIGWLRGTSVNLLSMDLSQWADIAVVDERRVFDFVREVPSAAGPKLTLGDGLAVAKRAGAGNLVMGDFLKLGNQVTLTAFLYDTRTGERKRTIRHGPIVPDSVLAAYSKLAREIAGADAPAGTTLDGAGTKNLGAYREYLAGIKLLNQFDIGPAKRHFERALEIDTSFALAHYKWAIASAYDEAARIAREAKLDFIQAVRNGAVDVDTARQLHAAAALRLSRSLPARERALIAGLDAHIRQNYAKACAAYAELVRADSSDVEALYGLGQCMHNDDVVEVVPSDTFQVRFRSSWNTAVRLYRRAVAVDPTFHLAFSDLLRIIKASSRSGCRRADDAPVCNSLPLAQRSQLTVTAVVAREGDSLRMGVRVAPLGRASLPPIPAATIAASAPLRREAARAAATAWVNAGPREGRAHRALAEAQLLLGLLTDAEEHLVAAGFDPVVAADPDYALMRMDVALRLYREKDVVRIHDSLSRVWKDETPRMSLGIIGPIVGIVSGLDTVFQKILAGSGPMPPGYAEYMARAPRFAIGDPGGKALAAEQQLSAGINPMTCRVLCTSIMSSSWILGLREVRTKWPPLDTLTRNPLLAPAFALARADTAGFRTAIASVDSIAQTSAQTRVAETGASILATDGFLILGDSAKALRSIARLLDTTMRYTSIMDNVGGGGALVFAGMLWPRAMLLRADLEAARGSKAEALVWYRRFLDLWAKPEPELQPIVTRAKAAYTALGGR